MAGGASQDVAAVAGAGCFVRVRGGLTVAALAPRLVEPVGYLDVYMTTLGYRIVPTIARVNPALSLRLNPDEVEDTFEVTLAFLMKPENHQRHSRDWNGMTRTFYAMPFGERYIWGATAGILRNLYERVYQG